MLIYIYMCKGFDPFPYILSPTAEAVVRIGEKQGAAAVSESEPRLQEPASEEGAI